MIRSKFRQNFHFRDISIGESIISPSPTIRNLGGPNLYHEHPCHPFGSGGIFKVERIITVTSSWARLRLKLTALRLFAQPFVQMQIKENTKASRHWPLCGEFTGDRWIPRTNGQQRGKCFHLVTSLWTSYFRRYLTDESTKAAVHAYITSRLDYSNSLPLTHWPLRDLNWF